MRGPDISEVKFALQARIIDICQEFLPRGKRDGSKWSANNPITADYKHKPALKIDITGGANCGAWKCYRSNDFGDILGLLAYVNGRDVKDHKFAYNFALDWLGIRTMQPFERQEMRKKAVAANKNAGKLEEQRRKRKLEAAKRLFEQAPESWHDWVKAGSGPLMPVQKHFVAYLADRNIAIDQVQNLDPMTFRFSPATEQWRMAKWKQINGRNLKEKDGPKFPAVHSAIRNSFGQLTSCHVTFLDPTTPKKAPIEQQKLMLGPAMGSFISITTGPTGKNPYVPQKAGPLAIAEGIETALTIAEAMPEYRIWAAGSLSAFGNCPIDLASVESVIICRDNNTGNADAENAFGSAMEKLEQHGKPVTVINPPEEEGIDDFNDLATYGV